MLRLKELRKKRGVSQAELAGRLGVPQQTYSNWENEVREMDYKTLIRMAVIFGVSVDYLLGRPVKNIEEEQK